MLTYIFMLGAILLLSLQTLAFKEFNRTYMKNLSSYFLFNFLYFSIVVLLFTGLKGIPYHVHFYTLSLGIAFGSLFIFTILSYMKAMETGPLSFSSLFFSFGILIPILFGLIVWKEKVNFIQFMGLALLLATFYLGNEPPEEGKQRWNVRWLIFCIAAFIGNGGLMTLSKSQQILLPGKEVYEFLIIAFGTSAVLSLLLFLLRIVYKRESLSHFKGLPLMAVILIAGVTTAFGNQLVMLLASRLPSVIQFPSVSGGIVILSSVISIAAFNEKVSKKGILGLALGLVALVLLSVR